MEKLLFGTGAVKATQEERVAAVPFHKLPIAKSVGAVDLPKSFYLESTTKLPRYYQGAFGMCVAMSLARYESNAYLSETKKNEKFAPAFPYGNRGKGDPIDITIGEGMSVSCAIKSFIANGIPFWNSMPIIGNYSTCHAAITDKIKAEAKPQHALSGVCMFPDHIWWGKGNGLSAAEILAIKTYLYVTKMPILFTADIYRDSFSECAKRGGLVSLVTASDHCDGTHEMVIEGYNEVGMFVVNSWGDTWGDGKGNCIFPWDYNSFMDFWLITDYVPETVDPPVVEPDEPDEPDPKPPEVVIPEITATVVHNAKKRKISMKSTDKQFKCFTIVNLKGKALKKSVKSASISYGAKDKGTFKITVVSKDEKIAKSKTVEIKVG